uniref:Putative ovule protein n=1 Tax=Solanum chacoense TaxID=4108 RepID=A0A0V0GSW9_SOLCH
MTFSSGNVQLFGETYLPLKCQQALPRVVNRILKVQDRCASYGKNTRILFSNSSMNEIYNALPPITCSHTQSSWM